MSEIVSTPNAAPYRVTFECEVWAWEDDEAWEVVDQLRRALAQAKTTRKGGLGIHHRIEAIEIRRVP